MNEANRAAPTATSRLRSGGTWVLCALVGAAFLAAGISKLSDPAAAAEGFVRFGLPGWLAVPVGACEILGGVALWIPRWSRAAAAGLGLIMIGAAASHLLNDPFSAALPALVLGSLCAVIAVLRGTR